MADAEDRAAQLRRQRENWMAQRAAAQEREAVEAEILSDPSGAFEKVAEVKSEEQFLDKITERITHRLREELRTEVEREHEEASRRKAANAAELENHLNSELEQTTCPICYELMAAPKNTPTLLFPCGHTFCIECLESHIKKNRNTCPYCRKKIESKAPNVLLQQLIDGFAEKKKTAIHTQKQVKPANPSLNVEASKSAKAVEALSKCPDDHRTQVEEYRREWNTLSMRWRIYENEALDCQKELESLQSKKDAGKIVKKHLSTELADAQHRLELVKQEIELIQSQIDQQGNKDEQMDTDIVEKKKRLQLIKATKETLEVERSRVRLMVEHYIPAADINALLDG